MKNNKLIREIDRDSYFGELGLLNNNKRSADVYAITNCTIYTLEKNIFLKLVSEGDSFPYLNSLSKNKSNYNNSFSILDSMLYGNISSDKNNINNINNINDINSLNENLKENQKPKNKIREILKKKISLMDINNIKLDDLFYMGHTGEGKFGSVSLVNNSKNFYAIKSVYRKYAENQKILSKYFLNERKILLSLEHPFIVKLIKTLKNEEYIFYLMEYINGIVLSKYLEKRSSGKNNYNYNYNNDINNTLKYEAMFISACLLSIVDYLNYKKIAHRDIKPDNIVIDEYGYVKLIDFGTAIEIKDFTYTITGTPHYIAPEILMGRGYGFSSDYWSIGITIFEIYFDYYPFGNNAKDPMDVYREVVKK
jgi:cGMP-dependent protein kinase